VASAAGLVVDDVYGEPVAMAQMLRGYDLVTLVVVVPVLAYSLIRARRGSERAELMWAGALAYLAYTYAYYVFGTSFNDLFPLHIVVFGTSVFALVLVLLTVDASRVADRLRHRTRERVVGGYSLFSRLRLAACGFQCCCASGPLVMCRRAVRW
jgi:hypothetical protein